MLVSIHVRQAVCLGSNGSAWLCGSRQTASCFLEELNKARVALEAGIVLDLGEQLCPQGAGCHLRRCLAGSAWGWCLITMGKPVPLHLQLALFMENTD